MCGKYDLDWIKEEAREIYDIFEKNIYHVDRSSSTYVVRRNFVIFNRKFVYKIIVVEIVAIVAICMRAVLQNIVYYEKIKD